MSVPAAATGAAAVLVNIMSSKVGRQPPLLTVQRSVALVPAAIPVTVVVANAVLVMIAVPLCKLHTPTPTVGTTAAIVKLLVLHCVILTPPSAVSDGNKLISVTSSNVLPQTPLVIVQRKTVATAPAVTPVTPLVAEAGVLTEPGPLITVHNPVPGAAAFPANVNADVLH